MDKILFNHMDINVAGTYVYVENGVAYKDSACENAFNTEALKNVFLKGAVIIDTDVAYKPVSFALNDEVGVLTYVKADTTTSTTAVLATVAAAEESDS